MGTGIGKVVPAGGADKLLAVNQRHITPCAGLCEKKGGEIVEVSHHAHGQSSCRRGGFLDGQLPACGIDIFAPAAAYIGGYAPLPEVIGEPVEDRKSTRLNSS